MEDKAHRTPHAAHCPLHTAHCTLHAAARCTLHAEHYSLATSLEHEIQLQMISEEQESSDDCDSGNDEPSDYLPLERRPSASVTPQQEAAGGQEEEQPALQRRQEPPAVQLESLADRLLLLEQPRPPADPALQGVVDSLPPEVLLVIFCHLDDISLYSVGNTCTRWRELYRTVLGTNES